MNRISTARAATATAVVLATTGGLIGAAATTSSAAVTCASPVFKRQFFANTSFSGTPKKTDCDSTIDQNWGTGAPASGLPSNYFGVRWSVTRDFGSGGPFTFTASSRDGIRVYLDGVRKVDLWKNVSTTVSRTVNLTVPQGKHSLRIDFVNWTGSANVKFAYTPRTTATVDKVKPLTPGGAALTYSTSTYKSKLSWTKSPEMDLAGYKVYRRVSGGSYPTKPLATTTSTSWTDTPPKDGTLYYYEVRAYDKAGNTSTGTADKGVTTVDLTAPATPAGLYDNWAPGFATKARLSWSANGETDLAGYRVYRATSLPVQLTAANRVTGDQPAAASWFVEPLPLTGDTYHYVVTAVDTHGNESAPTSVATYYTLDQTGPAETPSNLRAQENETGITLTWESTGVPSADSLGYWVYRSEKPRSAGAGREAIARELRGTAFTDRKAVPGKTYYYWVVAKDREDNLGTPSADVAVTVAGNTTAPAPVTGLTASPEENGVLLSWDAGDPSIQHYVVLEGRLTDGEWVYRQVSPNYDPYLPQLTSGTTFLRFGAADGEEVRYAVVAVDQYGNRVALAEAPVVPVTELDVRPTDRAELSDVPAGFTGVTPGEPRSPGYLHWWKLPANADGSAAATLEVTRWNPAEAAFEPLGTAPADDYDFFDHTHPLGTTVYYRVTVTYADGTRALPFQLPIVYRAA